MTNQFETGGEIPTGQGGAPAAPGRPTRPFWWSVRRELWENRATWMAPIAVACVALAGFLISAFGLAARRAAVLELDPAQQRAKIGMPYDMAALVLIVTGLVVAIFYSLDALHGERRDRSILFWKALPVSDTTTVLSKAVVPFVVIPSLVFALTLTVQILMFLVSSLVLAVNGMSPASTFIGWNPAGQTLVLAYGLIALVLWHAPLYGWFILVSAWARRAIIVWAVVPIIALSALFRVAWGSADVCSLLVYRVVGGLSEAFTFTKGRSIDSLSQVTPGRFFATPGLWAGLILSAVFLAAAVRVRHTREPL